MKFFLSFLLFCRFLAAEPLRVGMELSYPPFEMICYDGAPCGISVDLVEACGKFLGQEIDIQNIPFVGLIPSLQNGTIDLIVSSLTITEQRKKAINFSDPYATTGLCLLISAGSKVNDINQVNQEGKIAVVKSGTSGEVYAAQHLKQAMVRILDQESACVLEVVQGKADVFLYDQLSVYRNWKKNQTTTRMNLIPFQKEYWAIGVKRNRESLVKKINQFLKKFREEGGFDRLGERYLPEERKAFAKMGVPFVF